MIAPAKRLETVNEYYFSTKLKQIAQMNAEGMDIISLGIGSPDMPPADVAIEALSEAAKNPNNHSYQPYTGIPELRKAFSNYYKNTYNVELDANKEILPLIGSKEGILHITLAFVNNGDTVLIPNPGYPTYASLGSLLGANVVSYDLKEDDNWQPDFEALEKMDLSSVKLMWVNYPNMPTGTNATKELYQKLVDFAVKHDIVLVNDNPYSQILNKEPISILSAKGAKNNCIELNSLSKSHNMAGWRVGMIGANEQFISWILKVKSNIDSGTFKAMQLGAAAALDMQDAEAWHDEYNYNIYKQRRNVAEKIMDILNCKYDKKQVGMFLWGKIPDELANVEDLTEKLLHQARVFITPGFIFGSNGARYIRISLCASEQKLSEALNRIQLKIEKGKLKMKSNKV